ncbi:MAG: hypothetical protein KME29_17740 [Calothrix sp. FI2-JRJ7]|jgi:hypothetical protein|nr:hypothetical protein [Calothrix sp. FI2-JRJ7]
MPESVADKTPMPITIERRHIDPPGLWVAIVIGSVVLHSLLLWLMFTSKLNVVGRRSNAATPIKVVEVVPTIKAKAKPRVIAQKPKLQPKLESKQIQVKPKIKTQPVPAQPVINPVQPPQNQTSQPGTIAFTNKIPVKKPVNKSPLAQKQRSLPPIKPSFEQKTAIIPPKPVNTEPKKPNIAEIRRLQRLAEQQRLQRLAEQQRLQRLAEQQRLQELAQQRRLQQLAEQQRLQELAQQRRFDKLAQQQRQQELAEQQRLQKLAQQQRQQELAEQQRLQKLAQQQRTEELAEQQRLQKLAQQQRTEELAEQQRLQKLAQQQRQQQIDAQQRTEDVARNQAKLPVNTAPVEISGNPDTPFSRPTPVTTPTEAPAPRPTVKPTPTQKPTPTSTPATTTAGNTEGQGGFGVAILPIGDEEQEALKKTGGTILKALPQFQPTAKTPKELTILNEQDKKLVTEPIECGVWLSVDEKGNLSNLNPFKKDNPPVKAFTDSKVPGAESICQRYADYYFRTMKFTPAISEDGPAPGTTRTQITIEPAGGA